MVKTVCFGEIMLRLSPPGFERLFQSPTLQATFGGGEANVAVSLAQFGCDSYYVTRLPANAVGDAALRALRAEGVNVEHVVRGGSRLGIYFAETGASQRPSTVIYDRAIRRSANCSRAACRGTTSSTAPRWFHWTGITPALSAVGRRVHREAIQAARRAGVRVSVDLNYRKKLWSEREAQQTMRPLDAARRSRRSPTKRTCSRCSASRCRTPTSRAASLDVDGLSRRRERVAREFGVPQVAVTLRESLSASDNAWSAVLLRRRPRARSIRASATSCASWIASAAATASPPV